MKLNVTFKETEQSFKPQFGEVNNISDGGYERGYAEGYENGFADGENAGVIAVETLPNFLGKKTENENEFFFSPVAANSIWVKQNLIKFEGDAQKQYLVSCAVKCGTCTTFGVGFYYEDGTSTQSTRYTSDEYVYVCSISAKQKKVIGIGFLYGANGSGYVKNFYVKTME